MKKICKIRGEREEKEKQNGKLKSQKEMPRVRLWMASILFIIMGKDVGSWLKRSVAVTLDRKWNDVQLHSL